MESIPSLFGAKPTEEANKPKGLFDTNKSPPAGFFSSKPTEEKRVNLQKEEKKQEGLFGFKTEDVPSELFGQSYFKKGATGGLFSGQKDSIFSS